MANRRQSVAQGGYAGEIIAQRDRYYLEDNFNLAPQGNADILDATESTRMIAHPYFELLGTSASSGDATLSTGGGIKMETDGTDGNQVILCPHVDAGRPWGTTDWGTDDQVRWGCIIETGSAITTSVIWAGLKLTNVSVTATDDDQAIFRYENDVVSGRWQYIDSNDDTDTATDSGIAVAADTQYALEIAIDSARRAHFFLNGTEVKVSSPLATAHDLIPFIGIEEDGASSARHLYVRKQWISKEYNN